MTQSARQFLQDQVLALSNAEDKRLGPPVAAVKLCLSMQLEDKWTVFSPGTPLVVEYYASVCL